MLKCAVKIFSLKRKAVVARVTPNFESDKNSKYFSFINQNIFNISIYFFNN